MDCNADYKKCFMKSSDCGPFRNKSGIFYVKDLIDNIQIGKSVVKEDILIKSRSDVKFSGDNNICAYHRYTLGSLWRSPRRCLHPLHNETTTDWRKSKKKTSLRTATLHTFYLIKEKFPDYTFPMFGNLCSRHRSTEVECKTVEVEEEDPYDADFVCNTSLDDSSICTIHSLIENTTAGDMSPVKYRIAKPVGELAESSMRYQKRKYKEFVEKSKQTYLAMLAPGQEEEVSALFSGSDEEIEVIPDDLKLLFDAYISTDNEKQRTLILSAIPVESYSMMRITEVFGCTKHRVQSARKWRSNFGALNIGQQQQFTREKLDMNAVQIFLEFLFNSNLLQDVAYGTSILKFDNGSTQTVSKAILTLTKSHTINEYKQYCDNFNLKKLSDSTCWQILKAIKPGQQRAMAGLDNVTADGILGFQLLTNQLEKFFIDSKVKGKLKKDLETGKRYLKIGYAQHCSVVSVVNTHCISHGLCNKTDKDFCLDIDHSHNEICNDCFHLLSTLEQIKIYTDQLPQSDEKEEILYDITQATQYILTWMKHILRGVQQEKAKVFAMQNISQDTGLWISDWAQKVLPSRYREGQKEYFGKKGMSLHVDVLLMKSENDELVKQTYFTALDRCSQDIIDTLCVSDNVIKQINIDFPSLKYLYRKSDNAGCYAGNGVAENEYYICMKNCITLLRHDYNEPQMGKDQCDRDSAVAKKFINAFVHAGNNCLSADDIKKGILFKGGPKNSKVCVVNINKSICTMSKIPNISTFHSVSFGKDAMKFWQYYECGEGKMCPLNDMKFSSGLEIASSFESTQPSYANCQQSSKKRRDREFNDLFFCSVTGCTENFDTQDKLNIHTLENRHTFNAPKTTYDKVKSNFAELLQQSSHSIFGREKPSATNNHHNDSELMLSFDSVGWALPQRTYTRFSYSQKKFVFDEFVIGEETGKKMTGEKAAIKMRNARDSSGKKTYSSKDYLTKDQISGLFARFSKDKKRGKLVEPIRDNDQDEQEESPVFANEYDHEIIIDAVSESILLIKSHFELCINDFVYLSYSSGSKKRKTNRTQHFVGQITTINEDDVEINLLEESENYFAWPEIVKKRCITRNEIHVKLSCPSVDRRLHLLFSNDDLEEMKNCCKNV